MMHALRPSIFRPTSRPASPSPSPVPRTDSVTPVDRVPRAITKLSSLTTFRRPATSPGPPSPPAAIVQDGSYLQVLNLKLSETISKALTNPSVATPSHESLNGRQPIPMGRGRALGTLIETELKASSDNMHLRKAILRTLQRPLSTMLSTISTQLLGLVSSPSFASSPSLAIPAPHFNATQSHAIGLAMFAGEVHQSLETAGLGSDEGLRLVREGLASLINRVVNPLATTIKLEILSLISTLGDTPVALGVSSITPSSKLYPKPYHPSIALLHTAIPIYARAFTRLFAIPTTHPTLATLSIALVWHALVAIAHRPATSPTPIAPNSPGIHGTVRHHHSPTPPNTPPTGKFIRKLPSSRPPSPPTTQLCVTAALDARALHDILSTLPRPDSDTLAREAVDDAFQALRELAVLLELGYGTPLWHANDADALAADLTACTTELPTLIALAVLLNAPSLSPHTSAWRSIPEMLGMDEEEYRKGCLTGFGRVEECAPSVARRVLGVLRASPSSQVDYGTQAVTHWLHDELIAA